MWKPGQLITICGEVYRIKRCEHSYDACMNICKNCAFDNSPECELRIYEPKYRNCMKLIPFNCHFERVLP